MPPETSPTRRDLRPISTGFIRDSSRTLDPYSIYWRLLSQARDENVSIDPELEVALFERAMYIAGTAHVEACTLP